MLPEGGVLRQVRLTPQTDPSEPVSNMFVEKFSLERLQLLNFIFFVPETVRLI